MEGADYDWMEHFEEAACPLDRTNCGGWCPACPGGLEWQRRGWHRIAPYTYEADANRLCKGDTVVWGSSAHKGIYYVKGAGPQRIGGFYACEADVKKAGYKILE
jgi:hypothetical protein